MRRKYGFFCSNSYLRSSYLILRSLNLYKFGHDPFNWRSNRYFRDMTYYVRVGTYFYIENCTVSFDLRSNRYFEMGQYELGRTFELKLHCLFWLTLKSIFRDGTVRVETYFYIKNYIASFDWGATRYFPDRTIRFGTVRVGTYFWVLKNSLEGFYFGLINIIMTSLYILVLQAKSACCVSTWASDKKDAERS